MKDLYMRQEGEGWGGGPSGAIPRPLPPTKKKLKVWAVSIIILKKMGVGDTD
jgi:hypothetical protein